MKGKTPLNRINRFLISLLILSVGANCTQAVVLCTGLDGHVAVEIAGHHHGHGDQETEQASNDSHHGPDEYKTPCHSCVDIPLSPGIVDGLVAQKAPATITLPVGIVLPALDTIDLDYKTHLAAGACPAFTSFYNPLSSIILIV